MKKTFRAIELLYWLIASAIGSLIAYFLGVDLESAISCYIGMALGSAAFFFIYGEREK